MRSQIGTLSIDFSARYFVTPFSRGSTCIEFISQKSSIPFQTLKCMKISFRPLFRRFASAHRTSLRHLISFKISQPNDNNRFTKSNFHYTTSDNEHLLLFGLFPHHSMCLRWLFWKKFLHFFALFWTMQMENEYQETDRFIPL